MRIKLHEPAPIKSEDVIAQIKNYRKRYKK